MIENFSKVNMKLLATFILSLITISWANATHLRAGEITVERKNCTSREVFITVTVYTRYVNPATDVPFGQDGYLYFGDGSYFIIPKTDAKPQPELGPNIGIASYTRRHTYATNGDYLISYIEPNRNANINNMDESVWTLFYLETLFDLAVSGCNNSPKLRIPPIDQACVGQAFYHNPGAFDINTVGPADSLSYEKVVPFRERGTPVNGYLWPDNSKFSNRAEDQISAASYTIDPVDGTMIWNAPGLEGEYNVAFNVVEWRKINGVWKRIGYVRRDMQIIVDGDCANKRPLIFVPDDICVVAGSNINEDITALDQNNTLVPPKPPNPIRLQAYSQVFEFPISQSPARILGDTIEYNNPAEPITFDWNTICKHVRGQPYDVVFKATNDPPPYPSQFPADQQYKAYDPPNLATFGTWKINVIAPSPIIDTAIAQTPQRYIQVSWDSYECSDLEDDLTRMQVWRRVGETAYTPGNCSTGMPPGLGYTLVASVPLSATQYLDTNGGQGLERGVQYCYRLVAIFPNRGAESIVSDEMCIEPMEIAAPTVTKVSVDVTDSENGEITVGWIPPINNFEIRNEIEFDEYEYQVERLGATGYTIVSPKIAGTIDSTAEMTFTDHFLDTRDRQYSYRVKLYVIGNNIAVDSSSLASSVWLTLTTANRVVNLNWRASVPWSNQVPAYSHKVYIREGDGATTVADFLESESIEVDVMENGLQYRSTEYNGVQLDSTKTYCYLVEARGSYGNDRVYEPLVNLSQINCAIPTVLDPPCAPVIAAFPDACEYFFDNEYDCSASVFRSIVRWSKSCDDNIVKYEVYRYSSSDYKPSPLDKPIVIVTDTFAVFEGLTTLAYCYWIKAIDRSGNPSAFSEKVCSENCVSYELPNVFTPNGDNCNDFFSAFGVEFNNGGENPGPEIPVGNCKERDDLEYLRKCARFVERVDFRVYNRWGREVFDYIGQENNTNSIYINWNGNDKNGKELATGIYFYSADVTFKSTGPGGRTVKTLKGWVHLVR